MQILEAPMSQASLEDFVNEAMRVVWQEGQTEQIDRFYTDDAEIRGVIPNDVVSRSELANMLDHLLMLVSIDEVRVHSLVWDGAQKASCVTDLTITHKVSGKVGRIPASIYAEFKDNRIHRSSSVIDYLCLLEQLELLPDGALFLGLTGQVLK
ncbi:hypothetical protein [Primorskyibacter sp. S187A]|uniref:hypothetical protein n=1 Tax=Primorskyibacter sp. S187A TaxID=3415130 RepID=UPI003C7CA362